MSFEIPCSYGHPDTERIIRFNVNKKVYDISTENALFQTGCQTLKVLNNTETVYQFNLQNISRARFSKRDDPFTRARKVSSITNLIYLGLVKVCKKLSRVSLEESPFYFTYTTSAQPGKQIVFSNITLQAAVVSEFRTLLAAYLGYRDMTMFIWTYWWVCVSALTTSDTQEKLPRERDLWTDS